MSSIEGLLTIFISKIPFIDLQRKIVFKNIIFCFLENSEGPLSIEDLLQDLSTRNIFEIYFFRLRPLLSIEVVTKAFYRGILGPF